MKPLMICMLLSLTTWFCAAQESNGRIILENNHKWQLFYVDIGLQDARVYQMGSILDKAGTGYSLINEDTLDRKPDGTYAGRHFSIQKEGSRMILTTHQKRKQTWQLDIVRNLADAYTKLNNAWFLDQYILMANELNKAYPLNFSFRSAFSLWNEMPARDREYLQFRSFVNQHIGNIRDSISQQQDVYVRLTNNLLDHVNSMDYASLKDSVLLLLSKFTSTNWYFENVMNKIARHRPEDFFRMAEQMPSERDVIFRSAGKDDELISGLKNVQGHEVVKKEFFKDRKFNKTLPVRIIGAYVIFGGLLTWLIVSQK